MLHKKNIMKKNRLHLIVSAVILVFAYNAEARENVGISGMAPSHSESRSVMAGCLPSTDKADLDINNVRATMLGGGDMWWDLVSPKYFVPKPPAGSLGPCSLYAGALWIGGIDAGNVLKVAAMTYRQTGNDFWPGPLTADATTDPATCSFWDKHFKVNRADAAAYYNWMIVNGGLGDNPVSSSGMDAINNWPGVGPDGKPLAPFWDLNHNNLYEPAIGEIPDFDVTGKRGCAASLFGDQSLFWVFNDKGNIHTESSGTGIGIEVQEQAFAFQTNDDINNMTFYRYKIINKSPYRLDSTFFGVWQDPDLGSAYDDFVGCDVTLGLGMCYNADAIDDNPPAGEIAYGANPPAVGIDFFEGPYADHNGLDDHTFRGQPVTPSFLNYGDGLVDNERIGMAKFVYYLNDYSIRGNPQGAVNIYQYLTGTWLDGSPMTYGGTGHNTGVPCNYMFPGISDPTGFGTNGVPQTPWEEVLGTNVPTDNRTLQTAGPFTLEPGAVNTITLGAVWARATSGGNLASIPLMKGADVKAQKLFNNCFKTLDGPTAPNLTIQELNQQLILTWTNPLSGSNNSGENYNEDPDLANPTDSLYRFQGYIIYQLKDGTVSSTDYYNVDKARVVFQCDKKDGIGQIVNYYFDNTLNALVPKEMVSGADAGIIHSISLTHDKFATGDDRLINHKTYYYAIVAYGYSPSEIPDFGSLHDYIPFVAGRLSSDGANGIVHSGIPHIPAPQSGGTTNSGYGVGPRLKRVEGQGNGGNILDFTSETVSAILASSSGRVINPVYENGRGPVNIKVIDPLNVPDGNFRIELFDTTNTPGNFKISKAAKWKMTNLSTNVVVMSERTIEIPNEQIINNQSTGLLTSTIPQWGMSVTVGIAYDPGPTAPTAPNNGVLDNGQMVFADPTKQWLSALSDEEGLDNRNWIRSGTDVLTPSAYSDYAGQDNSQDFEKILSGTWAPYRLCAYSTPATSTVPTLAAGGPAWSASAYIGQSLLKYLASVDVIITPDKSKWTRCPVIEMEEETALAIGGAKKMSMRKSPSVDKQGHAAGDPHGYNAAEGDLTGTTGMGWFPGYAINLETGERLNMAFGEDSWLKSENGADMLWNPTSTIFSPSFEPIFGGKHYIYVFGHNGDKTYSGDPILGNKPKDITRYDQGQSLYDLYSAVAATSGSTSDLYKKEIYSDAMWVNIPLLATGHGALETDVTIKLRVSKSYQFGYSTTADPVTDVAGSPINNNLPTYEFNTSDIETHNNDQMTAQEALDLINIVPNPYYAYSAYEQTTLENKVKITNLPDNCSVSIYTLSGTLVRKFEKNNSNTTGARTSLDWDLKNQARVPVSSGMYIIYVNVPGVGEKTLKWFGVMRPIDLESY